MLCLPLSRSYQTFFDANFSNFPTWHTHHGMILTATNSVHQSQFVCSISKCPLNWIKSSSRKWQITFAPQVCSCATSPMKLIWQTQNQNWEPHRDHEEGSTSKCLILPSLIMHIFLYEDFCLTHGEGCRMQPIHVVINFYLGTNEGPLHRLDGPNIHWKQVVRWKGVWIE